MTRVTEYKTAGASSAKDLDVEVNDLIAKGFQPYGNPYLSDREVEGKVDRFVLWQAMVRYGAE